jgi:hypothetical protein
MDCFAEPVIGPRFAPTRWLAMTAERRESPPGCPPRARQNLDQPSERARRAYLFRRADAHLLTNQYGDFRVRQHLVRHTADKKRGKSAATMR